MPNILEPERETFDKRRRELLESSAGKFALVHGDLVEGIYETEMEAVRAGYQRFGLQPFLVRRIVPVDLPLEHASDVLLLK